MKNKDLQNIVLSKYQQGDSPTEPHRHLNGGISLAAIKSWCQMIYQSGCIHLLGTLAAPRIVRILKGIYKSKKPFAPKTEGISLKTLEGARYFCATSVRRILKIDLRFKFYKNGNRTIAF